MFIVGAATRNTAVGNLLSWRKQPLPTTRHLGAFALDSNTAGVSSTAAGAGSLFFATTGTNSAFGYNSGKYITTGSANTAIGTNAMTGVSATPLTGSNITARTVSGSARLRIALPS